MTQCPHLRSFRCSCVLLLLPLLLLLLQLLDALLQHVGPEVAFKVRQLISAGQTILCRLLEDVLRGRQKPRVIQAVKDAFHLFSVIQNNDKSKCVQTADYSHRTLPHTDNTCLPLQIN